MTALGKKNWFRVSILVGTALVVLSVYQNCGPATIHTTLNSGSGTSASTGSSTASISNNTIPNGKWIFSSMKCNNVNQIMDSAVRSLNINGISGSFSIAPQLKTPSGAPCAMNQLFTLSYPDASTVAIAFGKRAVTPVPAQCGALGAAIFSSWASNFQIQISGTNLNLTSSNAPGWCPSGQLFSSTLHQ